MVMHGEDVVQAVFVGVDVHHPAENGRLEAASGGVASVLGGDRAFQSKSSEVRGAHLIARRQAEIGVQMPTGDAEGHADVELVLGRALGHGVHRADEFVAAGSFFVQEGCGAGWIKI